MASQIDGVGGPAPLYERCPEPIPHVSLRCETMNEQQGGLIDVGLTSGD